MIIKLLLIAALGLAALMLLRGKRTALGLLMRRSLSLLAIGLGIFAVLFPAAVTGVANAVGVGRGTDLVVYVLAIAFVFVTISQHMRMIDLHDRNVKLARKQALFEAEPHRRDRQDLR